MVTTKTKKCPECNGNGEFVTDYFDPQSFYGHGQIEEVCEHCNGTGEIEVSELSALLEEKLEEMHAENYHGLDDDMPDAFDNWLAEMTDENPILEELLN